MNLNDYQTRPLFDGKLLNTLTFPPAGRSLNVLVDLLSESATAEKIDLQKPWTTIEQVVNKGTDTHLEVDLNFFAGTCLDPI